MIRVEYYFRIFTSYTRLQYYVPVMGAILPVSYWPSPPAREMSMAYLRLQGVVNILHLSPTKLNIFLIKDTSSMFAFHSACE